LILDGNLIVEDDESRSPNALVEKLSIEQNEKSYEGTIVLLPNKEPNKLPFKNVKCEDFEMSLRIDDRSWLFVEANDRVIFKIREKNGWTFAYDLKKKEQ
jgi:hypothetical protein